MADLVNININGDDFQVPAGLNVIEAARVSGVEIPHFCYHPNLPIAGSCRLCLVSVGTPARDRATGELVKNPDGSQKIAFMPKLAIACGTKVSEGMHVITNSERVVKARQGVLEFILANHPLDCPICDKAGECKLQEYSQAFGNCKSRFVEDKNVKPKKVSIGGGKVILDAERCILCSRCIRTCREIVGRDVLGFSKRGSRNEISVYGDDGRDSNYLLNIVDGCPVGALTESAFRFKMRTWFLKVANSVATESSAGINTKVWSRSNKIYRITPRSNPFVNDAWSTDSARYEYRILDSEMRLKTARVDGTPCSTSYAVSRAVEVMAASGRMALVASARLSLEEQFMLKEFADLTNSKIYAASHLGEDDGKLLSADRTPNMRGLFIAGLVSEYPKPDLKNLADDIRRGDIESVVVCGEDLCALGLDEKDFKTANIVYCGVLDSETAQRAKVAIPTASVFEKSGIFVNRQFRAQVFEPAVDAPESAVCEISLFSKFINALSQSEFKAPSVQALRKLISSKIEMLSGICDIPPTGLLLDGKKFDAVKFPETQALQENE